MKFSLAFLVSLILLNCVTFGNTVELTRWNIRFDIPDDFAPKDNVNIIDSVYAASRTVNKHEEVVCIVAEEEKGDLGDPDFIKNTISHTVKSGFRVIYSDIQTIAGQRFLVMDTRSSSASQAEYVICSENHTITLIFERSPAVELRMINDPTAKSIINSFSFIETPVAPPPKNSHSIWEDVGNLIIIIVVVCASLAIWKAMQQKSAKS